VDISAVDISVSDISVWDIGGPLRLLATDEVTIHSNLQKEVSTIQKDDRMLTLNEAMSLCTAARDTAIEQGVPAELDPFAVPRDTRKLDAAETERAEALRRKRSL